MIDLQGSTVAQSGQRNESSMLYAATDGTVPAALSQETPMVPVAETSFAAMIANLQSISDGSIGANSGLQIEPATAKKPQGKKKEKEKAKKEEKGRKAIKSRRTSSIGLVSGDLEDMDV